jgi:hypothetical protein
MPDVQDYLSLASEADDFAAWTPDAALAASYRRLAGSYHALARLADQISALPNGWENERDISDHDGQLLPLGAPNAVRWSD